VIPLIALKKGKGQRGGAKEREEVA